MSQSIRTTVVDMVTRTAVDMVMIRTAKNRLTATVETITAPLTHINKG